MYPVVMYDRYYNGRYVGSDCFVWWTFTKSEAERMVSHWNTNSFSSYQLQKKHFWFYSLQEEEVK